MKEKCEMTVDQISAAIESIQGELVAAVAAGISASK